MQAIEVSDLHSVASHDEPPTLTPTVCHSPKLAPITVTLADPVDPQFMDGCTTRLELKLSFTDSLNDTLSTDQVAVKLPDAPSPAVTARHLLPDEDARPE